MRRGLAGAFFLSFCWTVSSVAEPAERPTTYDDLIAQLAQVHGVPEAFVHRVVKRESRYQPGVVSRRCYGLMQLKHATARSMGYDGSPGGLLDPHVNLTYGIPYLANAYKLADGDADRAVRLYSSGYYSTAKRRNMVGELRTAASEPVASGPVTSLPVMAAQPVAAAPEPAPPPSPFGTLFSFLVEPPSAAFTEPGQ